MTDRIRAVLREHGRLPSDVGALADDADLFQAGMTSHASGASGMVYARHQIQVACIARHLDDAAWFEGYLADVAAEQRLIASATSEAGTGGDMGRSIAAVTPVDDGLRAFEKHGPTVS